MLGLGLGARVRFSCLVARVGVWCLGARISAGVVVRVSFSVAQPQVHLNAKAQ